MKARTLSGNEAEAVLAQALENVTREREEAALLIRRFIARTDCDSVPGENVSGTCLACNAKAFLARLDGAEGGGK